MDASLRVTLRTASRFLFLAIVGTTSLSPRDALAQAAKPVDSRRPDLAARGRVLFDDQQYEESIQVLSGALVRPGTAKEERTEILRLLSFNYITLGRKDEAEAAVRAILVADPSFALSPNESPRFRDFYQWTRERWEKEGRPGLVTEAVAVSPIVMTHVSPPQAEAGKSIELVAKVSDPARVLRVKLYVREAGNGKFTSLGTSYNGDTARVSLSGTLVKPPLIEYYLEGVDAGGLAVVGKGDAAVPLRIAVPEPRNRWILPVAIGAGVLGAAAIVGGLALGGVFDKAPPARVTTVSINIQ